MHFWVLVRPKGLVIYFLFIEIAYSILSCLICFSVFILCYYVCVYLCVHTVKLQWLSGPNAPGRFIVWFRNETTLLVLWQPPYPSGVFDKYKVKKQDVNPLHENYTITSHINRPGTCGSHKCTDWTQSDPENYLLLIKFLTRQHLTRWIYAYQCYM